MPTSETRNTNTNTTPKFWMCFVEGAQSPTVRHHSRDLAEAEAERLCRTTRKRTFIMEVVGDAELVDVELRRY